MMMMIMEHLVECELTGETEVLGENLPQCQIVGENLPQCQIVHHKSHMT
jgi:hypothetical protein